MEKNYQQRILENMCKIAEDIELYFDYEILRGEKPKAFKPGVADKFLFRRIIEENLEQVEESMIEKLKGDTHVTAINLMAYCYYPVYGEF